MAVRSLGQLTLDVLAKIGGFEKGMDAVERKSERTARQVERDQKKAAEESKRAWERAGAAIGVAIAGAVAGLTFAAKANIDFADAAGEAAESAGVATEAYTALAYAAKLSGVEQETLTKSLNKLNKGIAENSEELVNLGISTTDASGKLKSADAVLIELADRFAGMEDGAEKAALASRIFGERAGPDLVRLLNQGSIGIQELTEEARKLGVVIGDDFAKEAGKFNDNLDKLKASFDGLVITITGPVIAGINALIDRFREGSKEGESFIVTLLKQTEIARLLGVNQQRNQYTETRQELDRINTALQGSLLSEQQRLRFTQRKVELEREMARLLNSQAGAGRGTARDPRIVAGAFGQLPPVRPPSRTGLGGRTQAERDLFATDVPPDASELARRNLIASRQGMGEGEKRAIEDYNRLLDDGRRIYEQTRTPLERLNVEQANLNKLFEEGAIDADTLARATLDLQEKYQPLSETIKDSAEQLDDIGKELGLTFTSAFEDAIVSGKSFSDVLRGLEQDIIRIVTRKLVTEPLGNFISDSVKGIFGGGSSGGGIGGFFSSIFGSIFGGGRATGGSVMPNRLYEVNEQGPEMLEMGGRQYLMMGDQAGRVIPSSQAKGGNTINVQVAAVPGMSRDTALQQGARIGTGIQLAMTRNT